MRTKAKWWTAFALMLLVSVGAELVFARTPHHPLDSFGFSVWYGFLSSAGLVLLGKALGFFLKRRDGYYSDD